MADPQVQPAFKGLRDLSLHINPESVSLNPECNKSGDISVSATATKQTQAELHSWRWHWHCRPVLPCPAGEQPLASKLVKCCLVGPPRRMCPRRLQCWEPADSPAAASVTETKGEASVPSCTMSPRQLLACRGCAGPALLLSHSFLRPGAQPSHAKQWCGEFSLLSRLIPRAIPIRPLLPCKLGMETFLRLSPFPHTYSCHGYPSPRGPVPQPPSF